MLQALNKSWLTDTVEDSVFTSWPYFRELRTLFSEARKVIVSSDGKTRLDMVVDFSKKYYDNKSGKLDLETVMRNCAEVDATLRNHYKDAMSEERVTIFWFEAMKYFMPTTSNLQDHRTVYDKLCPDLIHRLKTEMEAEKVVILKPKAQKSASTKPRAKSKPKGKKVAKAASPKAKAKSKAQGKVGTASSSSLGKRTQLSRKGSEVDEPKAKQPKTQPQPQPSQPKNPLTKRFDYLDSVNETIAAASLPLTVRGMTIDEKLPVLVAKVCRHSLIFLWAGETMFSGTVHEMWSKLRVAMHAELARAVFDYVKALTDAEDVPPESEDAAAAAETAVVSVDSTVVQFNLIAARKFVLANVVPFPDFLMAQPGYKSLSSRVSSRLAAQLSDTNASSAASQLDMSVLIDIVVSEVEKVYPMFWLHTLNGLVNHYLSTEVQSGEIDASLLALFGIDDDLDESQAGLDAALDEELMLDTVASRTYVG